MTRGLTDRPTAEQTQLSRNRAHKANNASSWWHNDCMTTWLLKDWLTIRPSYRDAKMHLEGLVFLLWLYFTRKCWFSLFWTKAWQTDGRIDQWTDWRTDRPGYRDARTHVIKKCISRHILSSLTSKRIELDSFNVLYEKKNQNPNLHIRECWIDSKWIIILVIHGIILFTIIMFPGVMHK